MNDRRALLRLLAAAAAAAGCARPAPPEAQEDRLVVFAAASLREVFSDLGRQLERARPGLAVTFNFAGSQELRTQIEHGAAADVFASADARHMEALVRAGRAAAPVIFARNEPVIVVAPESAAAIRGIEDLPRAARLVFGAPEVPIGRYTERILERASARFGAGFRAGVEAKVASRELNVRQVLTKVGLGEAQAGVVYRSDVRAAAGRVVLVEIPPALNVVAEYPIAALAGAPHPHAARAFVALVLSPDGQRALAAAGFLAGGDAGR